MKRFFLGAALFFTAAVTVPGSAAFGQNSGQTSTGDIRALLRREHEIADAYGHNDFPLLSRILPSEYIAYSETGAPESRETILAQMRAGDRKYEQYDLSNLTVRVFGDTAIALADATGKRSSRDATFSLHDHYMRVYVRRGPAWVPVATQWGVGTQAAAPQSLRAGSPVSRRRRTL